MEEDKDNVCAWTFLTDFRVMMDFSAVGEIGMFYLVRLLLIF